MATTVRVDDKLHTTLRELALAEHKPIGQVIEEAVERYKKEKFWQGVQDDFARLHADPARSKDYQNEIALWEATAGDGLRTEEPYYTPDEEAEIDAHYARTYGG